jgi:glutamate-1-semialdehyde 2,1-aminomutase
VITARLHTGGRQTQLGITPDLTTLGKVIGGGLPIGAVGGRADVMEVFDPRRPRFVEHHGTFNGNGLATAAGCASLDALPQAEIDRIDALGARLESGLTAAIAAAELPGHVTRVGSLLHVHLPAGELHALHAAALAEGLYMAPRGQMSISTPMDDALVDAGIAAFARAADRVAERTGASA